MVFIYLIISMMPKMLFVVCIFCISFGFSYIVCNGGISKNKFGFAVCLLLAILCIAGVVFQQSLL